MTVKSVAFTKIHVTDLDAAERFYCEILGLGRVMRLTGGEGALAFEEAILSADGSYGPDSQLILVSRQGDTPAPGEAIVGFMVEQLDALLTAVQRAGGRVLQPAQEAAGHGLRVAYVADPEGHTIEFLERLETA